jgi:hypothetical protein
MTDQKLISAAEPPKLYAFSIEEFCRRHSISRGTYFNLRAKGEGPREAHVLGRVLITKEAAKEWRLKITDATP